MNPEISVVVVNYNSGSALASTLASLSGGLDGIAWEAVVVDNASTDGSECAAEGHPNVRVVRHHANAGFAAGVNIGTAASSAPFLLVLNPDCRLRAGTGLLLLNELQATRDMCGDGTGHSGSVRDAPGKRARRSGYVDGPFRPHVSSLSSVSEFAADAS